MNDNVVTINDQRYIFEDMSETAQVAYQQLLSIRSQAGELQMKLQQLDAARSVFEQALQAELENTPAEGEVSEERSFEDIKAEAANA